MKIITSVFIINMGIHCLCSIHIYFGVGEFGPVNILWKHFFSFRIFFLRFWVALVVIQWSIRPKKNVIDYISAVKGNSNMIMSKMQKNQLSKFNIFSMIESLNKIGIRWSNLNILKVKHDKLILWYSLVEMSDYWYNPNHYKSVHVVSSWFIILIVSCFNL